MNAKRLIAVLGASAALALVVAACGGSGSSNNNAKGLSGVKGTPANTKCGLGNGQKATGEPIVVGALETASGGVDFSSAPEASNAYFNCVNANGGINGRPIQYEVKDDGLSPEKASVFLKQMISNPNLVAFAGSSTFVGCSIANPLLQKADLYMLSFGVPEACFKSSNIVPVNAGPRNSAIGAVEYFVEHDGVKSVATIDNSIPGVGPWAREGVEEYAKQAGVEVVSTQSVTPPVKDASSIVIKAKEANPELTYNDMDVASVTALLKAQQQQGIGPTEVSCSTVCYETSFPSSVGSYWTGLVAASEFAPLDSKSPENELWRRVLEVYGTSSEPRDSLSQGGFLAAKILADTLLKLKPNEITRPDVSKAIEGITDYKSSLLCTPFYVGKASEHNPNHTIRVVEIVSGGTFNLVQNCQQVKDPALAGILAQEKSLGL